MPLELHLERDPNGRRRARVAPHLLPLSEFLESDLQGSVPSCDEVLHHVAAVGSHSQDRWERIGNACTLTLIHDQARIEHDYLPDLKCVIPLSDLGEAVSRWKDFVQNEIPTA